MHNPGNINVYANAIASTSVVSFHRGYGLRASTERTVSGLHSADLVIEVPGRPPQTFTSLDFFYDDQQAICYAHAWGRIWVDSLKT